MHAQNYGNDNGASEGAGWTLPDPHSTLDQAASKAHATVDRVHRKATQVSDRVSTQGEQLASDACGWVKKHPVQAVAGALLAGYLIGRIRR